MIPSHQEQVPSVERFADVRKLIWQLVVGLLEMEGVGALLKINQACLLTKSSGFLTQIGLTAYGSARYSL